MQQFPYNPKTNGWSGEFRTAHSLRPESNHRLMQPNKYITKGKTFKPGHGVLARASLLQTKVPKTYEKNFMMTNAIRSTADLEKDRDMEHKINIALNVYVNGEIAAIIDNMKHILYHAMTPVGQDLPLVMDSIYNEEDMVQKKGDVTQSNQEPPRRQIDGHSDLASADRLRKVVLSNHGSFSSYIMTALYAGHYMSVMETGKDPIGETTFGHEEAVADKEYSVESKKISTFSSQGPQAKLLTNRHHTFGTIPTHGYALSIHHEGTRYPGDEEVDVLRRAQEETDATAQTAKNSGRYHDENNERMFKGIIGGDYDSKMNYTGEEIGEGLNGIFGDDDEGMRGMGDTFFGGDFIQNQTNYYGNTYNYLRPPDDDTKNNEDGPDRENKDDSDFEYEDPEAFEDAIFFSARKEKRTPQKTDEDDEDEYDDEEYFSKFGRDSEEESQSSHSPRSSSSDDTPPRRRGRPPFQTDAPVIRRRTRFLPTYFYSRIGNAEDMIHSTPTSAEPKKLRNTLAVASLTEMFEREDNPELAHRFLAEDLTWRLRTHKHLTNLLNQTAVEDGLVTNWDDDRMVTAFLKEVLEQIESLFPVRHLEDMFHIGLRGMSRRQTIDTMWEAYHRKNPEWIGYLRGMVSKTGEVLTRMKAMMHGYALSLERDHPDLWDTYNEFFDYNTDDPDTLSTSPGTTSEEEEEEKESSLSRRYGSSLTSSAVKSSPAPSSKKLKKVKKVKGTSTPEPSLTENRAQDKKKVRLTPDIRNRQSAPAPPPRRSSRISRPPDRLGFTSNTLHSGPSTCPKLVTKEEIAKAISEPLVAPNLILPDTEAERITVNVENEGPLYQESLDNFKALISGRGSRVIQPAQIRGMMHTLLKRSNVDQIGSDAAVELFGVLNDAVNAVRMDYRSCNITFVYASLYYCVKFSKVIKQRYHHTLHTYIQLWRGLPREILDSMPEVSAAILDTFNNISDVGARFNGRMQHHGLGDVMAMPSLFFAHLASVRKIMGGVIQQLLQKEEIQEDEAAMQYLLRFMQTLEVMQPMRPLVNFNSTDPQSVLTFCCRMFGLSDQQGQFDQFDSFKNVENDGLFIPQVHPVIMSSFLTYFQRAYARAPFTEYKKFFGLYHYFYLVCITELRKEIPPALRDNVLSGSIPLVFGGVKNSALRYNQQFSHKGYNTNDYFDVNIGHLQRRKLSVKQIADVVRPGSKRREERDVEQKGKQKRRMKAALEGAATLAPRKRQRR